MISNSLSDTFYIASKWLLLWMAPHLWVLFLLFGDHKEEPHIELYRLLNLWCNKLTGFLIHKAPSKSHNFLFQLFKLGFRSVHFNYKNLVCIKLITKKKKLTNTNTIVPRNNWCQSFNYLYIINFNKNDSYINPLMSQNGKTNFKNFAVLSARFLKCVWPIWNINH